MLKRWAGAFAYLPYVGTIVVAGLEVLLRVFFSDPEYYWDSRFGFVSPKAVENHVPGVWTYRPYTAIREAAVYALPTATLGTRFVVEYDCRMQANNWGLLQQADIEPGMIATIVVGDSFTAGQGGCPWFERLVALRNGELLINAGLMGTGIEQWRRLIIHLQERGLVVRRVLAIAISNNFKRAVWSWRPEEIKCFDEASCPADYHAGLWLPADDDDSQARLIERGARGRSMVGTLTARSALWARERIGGAHEQEA
jgi:hypothetical protein